MANIHYDCTTMSLWYWECFSTKTLKMVSFHTKSVVRYLTWYSSISVAIMENTFCSCCWHSSYLYEVFLLTSLCSYSGVTWFVTLQKVKYLNNWQLFFMANCAFSLDAMRCCYSLNMKIVLFYLFCENEVGCIRWLVVHLRWDAVGEKELTRLNETPDLSASAKSPR